MSKNHEKNSNLNESNEIYINSNADAPFDDIVKSNVNSSWYGDPLNEGIGKNHVKKSGVRLSWNNLYVSAQLKASPFKNLFRKSNQQNITVKKLLDSITGAAEPSSLLAIMGASGAGKTTLLNVLSGQNVKNLQITGDILVNNKNIHSKIKKISAYVQQEELFIGTLTVREHLLFQAYLRMPEAYSTKEKEKRVDDVIAQFGLGKCQNTVIGVAGRIRGISGGENKRLAFASEIITDPKLLFVDEPTSGLDSFMAESVITCLQKIASEGTTIIATIHQPSSEVFVLFDRLLLLSEGRTAYLGPRRDALAFFESVNFPCPSTYNPADHFIHTLAVVPGQEVQCRAKCHSICDAFSSIQTIQSFNSIDDTEEDSYLMKHQYKVGFFKQLRATVWRSWRASLREPFMTKIRLFTSVFIGLISGLVFLKVGKNTTDESNDVATNVNGALFFTVMTQSFSALSGSLYIFPAEIPVFLKEHKLAMYRPDVYFISKTLSEFPWYVIGPVIYSTIFYFMVGLRTDAAAFFIFVGIVQLLNQAGLSFGYFISSISPTVQVATSVGPPLIMPFVLFGGFFLKDMSIPDYFIWLKWLSFVKYGAECVQINQWANYGQVGHCNGTNICFDGKKVLESNGYSKENFNRNIGLLFALIFGFRILALFFVMLRARLAK
ncbi:protein white isoform X2 [Hydra vulgaris]|uniref:protein white isoform X2 n=1 Tax=Hydra vulgaris TaxID=6087 RepID=UPI0032EA07A6